MADNLYTKLARVMGAVSRLKKTGRNVQFGYDYVTESDVADMIRAALAENNVAFLVSMIESKRTEHRTTKAGNVQMLTHVVFEFTFACGDSGDVITRRWEGEALDTEDKGLSKAATLAEKYFLLKTFVMSTDDPLDDPDSGMSKSRQQRPPLPRNQPDSPAQPKHPAAPPPATGGGSYKTAIGKLYALAQNLYADPQTGRPNPAHMKASISKLEELGTLRPDMTVEQAAVVVKQHKLSQALGTTYQVKDTVRLVEPDAPDKPDFLYTVTGIQPDGRLALMHSGDTGTVNLLVDTADVQPAAE